MLTLGIDSGTQSTKAVVLDTATGLVVASARAPHAMVSGLPPGHMEQEPSEWVAAMESTIRSVLAEVDAAAVKAIAVSGQQHGFVPLDGAGAVIRPAKLWCDTSTAEECRLLTEAMGGREAVVAATGLPFLPGYTAPKVLWLRRHEPEAFARLRTILLPHDYLNFVLTGERFTEWGDASGTAILDVRARRWSRAAAEACGPEVEACLPRLVAPDRAAGVVHPDVASRLGLPAGVLVAPGGGDNMMGAIGTGNVGPGVVTASFGTSGTIYAWSGAPVVDPAGEIAAFCDSTGAWLPLLCTMNVTTVTELWRRLFGADHAAVDAAVAAVPPGAGGLVLLPYFAGERTPSVPDGTGVLLGLRQETLDRGALLRAAMEGVTLGMNHGLRRLGALGVRPTEIRLTGGGARSAAWRRIMADVFGVPVAAMVEDEGAALGAALQAAWAAAREAGAPAGLAELCGTAVAIDESTRVEPGAEAVERYRGLQEIQDELSAAVRGVFAKHRRWLG